MQPSNVRALITGASGGIGAALATELAHAGSSVLLTGRCATKLAKLSSQIPAKHCLGVVPADLCCAQDRQTLVTAAQAARVNTLINLGGTNELATLADQSAEAVERIVQTNLLAPIQLTRMLQDTLSQPSEAMVVNVGSTLGSIGHPGYSTYCASKFGLRGFSEALRREWSASGIVVVYVAPRTTSTAMNTELAQSMNAALGNKSDSVETVAHRIVQAMTRAKPETHIGWPEQLFVQLNRWLPALVDSALAKKLDIVVAHSRPQSHNTTGKAL